MIPTFATTLPVVKNSTSQRDAAVTVSRPPDSGPTGVTCGVTGEAGPSHASPAGRVANAGAGSASAPACGIGDSASRTGQAGDAGSATATGGGSGSAVATAAVDR